MSQLLLSAGNYLKQPFFFSSSFYLDPRNFQIFQEDLSFDSLKKITAVALSGILGLLSIPAYFLGAGLIGLNACFNPQDFYLRQFNVITHPAAGPIKVATYNICGFEGGFPIIFGGMEPVASRVDALAQKILRADANIICLQEAQFTAVNSLGNSLASRYPYQYTHIGESGLFFPSGLAVFSDRPIDNPQYSPYEGTYFMNRGMFQFEVEGKTVITTHLSPGVCSHTREQEIPQIERLIPNDSRSITILGDFNQDMDRISNINKVAQESLLSSTITATNTFKWEKTGVDESEPAFESIDHILSNRGRNLVIDPHYGLDSSENPISDHLLISAIIE